VRVSASLLSLLLRRDGFRIASGYGRGLGVYRAPKGLLNQPVGLFWRRDSFRRRIPQHAALAPWRALTRSFFDQSSLRSSATW
jgi:hypothetical protein